MLDLFKKIKIYRAYNGFIQLSQKVTVQGIDKFMFCRIGQIVAIWAVCRDFVPSGERRVSFRNDAIMILQQHVRAAAICFHF